MYAYGLLPLIVSTSAVAREIVFPPIAAIHGSGQVPLGKEDSVDIVTGSQFSGLTTFANLPYVNCLVDDQAQSTPYDIAILGAPFDTGVTARPGARYGPGGIRLGSRRLQGWSVYTGVNVFKSWATMVISSRPTNSTDLGRTPRILTLGGDHTTTLSALRSTYDKWGPVSVIHFDSHLDTWDPEVLGGGISHYAGVNHGTFLHIAHEEGLIRNTSLHVGIRAPVMRRKGDIRNDIRCGFEIIKARDLDRVGINGIVEQIKSRVGDSKVYISVDIDVLDPAYAPATGTAEPGGFTTRELLSILDALHGLPVIGADVVEVAPIYDTAAETTTLAAAEVAHSLLYLMVETPPHADSSYFGANASKSDIYTQVLEQAQGLVYGQRNWIRNPNGNSNFSNVASLLWHAYAALPSPSSSVNWAGFYIRQDKFPNAQPTDTQKPVLWLGPFQGRPACQEIRFGRGVCGTAAEKRETVLVGDVLSFPGHIACDASSRSEIVVPILVGGETVAIIDVDCTEPNGFDEVDQKYLEDLAKLLAEACDW
ncbi:agmatinase 1 [Aspergillus bombycis]|uniref:Agmatinase 1 n=1 Tax=Aspergillus bombycis TaxID=109264 RepID=A0A1F8A6M9_9EURO|nr:agmatinase 1 [Aspergillus bombycis]OGM47343.1 agmatinase 1 [Aspergillus bombycis]